MKNIIIIIIIIIITVIYRTPLGAQWHRTKIL